ncbi:MAG: DUF4920 domain-containing protein [Phycisphaerae bacterium]
MCKTRGLMVVAALGVLVGAGCAAKHADFGEPLKLPDTASVSVGKVLANPGAYEGRPLRVSGQVKEVCGEMGCWLTLADRDTNESIFVKFVCPIEGRLIPLDAVGKQAVVEGSLKVTEIDEGEARHIAEEAGKSAEQIAKIVGPQKQYRIQSPAARVWGVDPAASTAKYE